MNTLKCNGKNNYHYYKISKCLFDIPSREGWSDLSLRVQSSDQNGMSVSPVLQSRATTNQDDGKINSWYLSDK